MCSNRKIQPEWEIALERNPEVLILDEFTRADDEFRQAIRKLASDTTPTQREYSKPGLTMKTHWNLIRHRVEKEYEANQD